jgi:uncharacterized membrane protein HdeD (DUF308 family)
MVTLNPIRWLFASPSIFVLLFGIYCITQVFNEGIIALVLGIISIYIGGAVTIHYLTDK